MNKRFTYWFESPGYLNPSESFVIQTFEWGKGEWGCRQEPPGRKQLCSNLKEEKKVFHAPILTWMCFLSAQRGPGMTSFSFSIALSWYLIYKIANGIQATVDREANRHDLFMANTERASLLRSSECQRITRLDYIKFLKGGLGKFLSSFPNSKSSSSSWVSKWNLHFVSEVEAPEAQAQQKGKEKKSEKLISLKGEFNFMWFSIWLMLNFLAGCLWPHLDPNPLSPSRLSVLSWRWFSGSELSSERSVVNFRYEWMFGSFSLLENFDNLAF